MFTAAARRSCEVDDPTTVTTVRSLVAGGWDPSAVRAQIRARRWQRVGRAIIRHNATPTAAEQRRAALIVLGPRAALTSFTALEEWGLSGWERDPIHVLVPRGARVVRPSELPLRIHYTGTWQAEAVNVERQLHRAAPAAVLAASSFPTPRPACGVLAAVVQQRLVSAATLLTAVTEATRTRHRAALLAAAHDIGQGAHALSEIDFARLCHQAGLPTPIRQAVRRDPSGRRRYLDVEWIRPDGRRVVVEVDGALHLVPQRFWDDQLRQNELVIGGDIVLRFPSAVVRHEPWRVIDQLRRVLFA